MNDVDTIGVVREHRWAKAEVQVKRLEADGCRIIVTLAGGKRLNQVTREELAKLTRPGTVLKVVYAFLLADPRKRFALAMRTDLASVMDTLTKKRGGILKDVDTGLTTEKPEHRRAIVAVANEQIGLSCKGARSAVNGQKKKGRAMVDFTPNQMKEAKSIWRNMKDYPTWDAAAAALREITTERGDPFTTARAYKLWQGRY
jgi:hypothetical protein